MLLWHLVAAGWVGQSPYMMQPGAMMMVQSNDPNVPPSYAQVCPPNMYPQQYQYFSSHPGSGAGSQISGGSGGSQSGSQKSGQSQKNSQRDLDQVTVRSSGSSERSHSSKGSKRKQVLDDRSSLSSFHSDTISLRSEIMADNRSISSHHGIPAMVPMAMVSTAQLPHGISQEQLAQQMQQLHIQQQQQMQQQLHHQQQQLQQQPLQPSQLPQPQQQQPLPQPQQQQQDQPRELGRLDTLPSSISASRQSFRMAMGNTSNEFFVDVM